MAIFSESESAPPATGAAGTDCREFPDFPPDDDKKPLSGTLPNPSFYLGAAQILAPLVSAAMAFWCRRNSVGALTNAS